MEWFRKPRLIDKLLTERPNVDNVQDKPYQLQVWKIYGKVPSAQTNELVFVELSDTHVTIPALISTSPTSGDNQDRNVALGCVISTMNAKLTHHLMSSGKKIGVHLLAEEYSIISEGTSLNPELQSVNDRKEIRVWLDQLEIPSSAESQKKFINIDNLARQAAQAEEQTTNDPDAKMEIDGEDDNESDAEVLIDIAYDSDQRPPSEESPSPPSTKRAKLLPVEGTPPPTADVPKDEINFGWDDCKYVEDFECVIPEDQHQILVMLDGWNLRETTPQSTPQLRVSSNLIEVPCNVECQSVPVSQNNVNKNTNKQESMDSLISQFAGQRHAVHSAHTPRISFTTI